MILDTKGTVIRVQLRRFLQLVVFLTAFLAIMFLMKKPPSDYLGLTKYNWVLILAGLYALAVILESLLELNYIYFSDKEDRLVFRYFSMSVLSSRKRSIEIPKDKFTGYSLVKDLYGLKKKIILRQKLTKSEASYPPVSLSGLNKKELKQLLDAFDRYAKN